MPLVTLTREEVMQFLAMWEAVFAIVTDGLEPHEIPSDIAKFNEWIHDTYGDL